MKTWLILFTIVLLNWSCSKPELDPAQSIEGNYQAKLYQNDSQQPWPYPIGGQNVILEIKSVAPDTAQVTILPSIPTSSFPKNVYSPLHPLTYSKAFIKAVPRTGYTAYYVYLIPPTNPTSLSNAIVLTSTSDLAFYNFPATPEQDHTIEFEKLH